MVRQPLAIGSRTLVQQDVHKVVLRVGAGTNGALYVRPFMFGSGPRPEAASQCSHGTGMYWVSC